MKKLLMISAVFAFSMTTHANDSAFGGVGGTAYPLNKGQTQVRMVSEHVYVQLPECKVKTVFVFKNEGPATTVKMGFPEEGFYANSKLFVSKNGKSSFKYFRSRVDGKPVQTQLIQRNWKKWGHYIDYKHWWVKSVPFKKGQTRVVVNEYQTQPGEIGGMLQGFNYIVQTGANWKGNISNATITVDVSHLLKQGSKVDKVSPSGYKKVGQTYVWERKNFAPKPSDNIEVLWPNKPLPNVHKK